MGNARTTRTSPCPRRGMHPLDEKTHVPFQGAYKIKEKRINHQGECTNLFGEPMPT